MKRLGICVKCGKETTIRSHHYKGYGTDETLPYCLSCDRKAHIKARKEGRCTIPTKRTTQLSKNSYRRRWQYIFRFTDILSPNINLHEEININLSTNNLSFWSGFVGNNGNKLKEINERRNENMSTEHMRKRRYDALDESQKAIYWGMRANLATHDEAIEAAENVLRRRGIMKTRQPTETLISS